VTVYGQPSHVDWNFYASDGHLEWIMVTVTCALPNGLDRPPKTHDPVFLHVAVLCTQPCGLKPEE
jgi:hypothetical protein